MTEPSEDELAEFSHLVVELEQRLEQSFAAHDLIIARQAANDQENARLRAGLAAAREIRLPVASMHNLAALSAELTGKLNEVLKPAALDDKTRAEVDELTRQLTANLDQLAQHAQRADTIAGDIQPHSREGSRDSWADEIDALRHEFPDQGSSQALSGQDPSGQASSAQALPAGQVSPGEDLPDQNSSDPACSREQQG